MSARARLARLVPLAFVGPYLSLYVVFLILPLVMGVWLAFQQADLFGSRVFVGVDNFARLAADPVFLQALGNTFKAALMIVPPLTAISLFLALALNKPGRTAAVFRGIFFASSVLSVTIVTLIWRFVLTPDAGLLAEAARAVGAEPTPFLSSPDWALPSIAVATVWWSVGFPMLLFLAGLQQVPQDVYEAAALDRASRWTTFWRVTLPSIRRTLVLVVMLQTAGQLQLFGQAQLLTAGGPGGASRPIVLFIFEAAFARWELGYAMAASQILFGLVLLVTLLQYRVVGGPARD